MSTSSDSEEFYDAEDLTPSHGPRKGRKTSKESLTQRASSEPNVSTLPRTKEEPKHPQSVNEIVFIEPQKKKTPVGGRRKFKELRQKLQNDDEDCQTGNVTPPNSQSSSVDGVFAASYKTSHPFRIIEQDTVSLQSINSLGRLTRILGVVDGEGGRKAVSVSALSSSSLDSGSTPSSKGISQYPSNATISTLTSQQDYKTDKPSLPLQEPDVIASTKASSSQKTDDQASKLDAPVAPPRRKKKNKAAALAIKKSASSTTFESSDLASPASTIESLTREFEHSLDRLPSVKSTKSDKGGGSKSSTLRSGHSLDIKEALKGQFVVKPQDTDSLKAQNSKETVGEGGEKASRGSHSPRGASNRSSVGHYSLGPHRGTHQSRNRTTKERRRSAGDENMLKDVNLRVRTHTDSGKQLSDFEILQQVTVLNLDTGERVPLSVAEDKLPQCINPLSLHIMRLTSEYVSSSSMEKEKESDEESEGTRKVEIPIVDDNEEMGRMRKKTAMLKKFVGTAMKKTMHKAKSIAQEVSHARHKDDAIDIADSVNPGDQSIKLKVSPWSVQSSANDSFFRRPTRTKVRTSSRRWSTCRSSRTSTRAPSGA
jgi:hypothetical protein